MRSLIVVGLFAILLLPWDDASGDMRGPRSGVSAGASAESLRQAVGVSPADVWARGAYVVYRHVIRPARGGACPMHPSCSHYSEQAFQKRGPLIGLLVTADRLIRCGGDSDMYLRILTRDGVRRYDPVSD